MKTLKIPKIDIGVVVNDGSRFPSTVSTIEKKATFRGHVVNIAEEERARKSAKKISTRRISEVPRGLDSEPIDH